jgi:hypothetical protein
MQVLQVLTPDTTTAPVEVVKLKTVEFVGKLDSTTFLTMGLL